ncbi:MAG: hypothetical protein IT200_10920 [Thermoleophilia bacterium]|nr:hypothetical protein [Thermoleophilia bacterium]
MTERWTLIHDGHEHVVEIADAGLGKRLTWSVDGEEVASRRTGDQRVVLEDDRAGAVGVRLPALTGPARRVTLHPAGGELPPAAAARAGLGGIDLDPEPGSAAAARDAWIRAHPRWHVVRRAAAAAVGIAVPLLAVWLLSRFALPRIPWPDWSLPDPPLPDLPDIPWPEVPWPDWDLPAWVHAVIDAARFAGPVVIAVVLAVAEIRRRRRHDARRGGSVRIPEDGLQPPHDGLQPEGELPVGKAPGGAGHRGGDQR